MHQARQHGPVGGDAFTFMRPIKQFAIGNDGDTNRAKHLRSDTFRDTRMLMVREVNANAGIEQKAH